MHFALTENLSAAQNFVEASAPRNDKLSSSDDTTNTPQFHKRLASSSSRTNTNNINNDNGNTITASPNSPSRPTQLQLPNSGQPVKLRTTELFFTDGKFIKGLIHALFFVVTLIYYLYFYTNV